jgi:hypothetical protein
MYIKIHPIAEGEEAWKRKKRVGKVRRLHETKALERENCEVGMRTPWSRMCTLARGLNFSRKEGRIHINSKRK